MRLYHSDKRQLDEKISDLLYFRRSYQKHYLSQINSEVRVHPYLVPPDEILIEVAKYILAWLVGNVSWDLVKVALQRKKDDASESGETHIVELIEDEQKMNEFIQDLRNGLEDFSDLPSSVQRQITEEVRLIRYEDDMLKQHKLALQMYHGRKKYLKPLLRWKVRRIEKKSRQRCDIYFTEQEKEEIIDILKK